MESDGVEMNAISGKTTIGIISAGIGVRPIRRLSLKKSRAFGDLSGMSSSSSENSLELFNSLTNSKQSTNSRIRTSSEPNCSNKKGDPDDEDDDFDSIRVKKTRSENRISVDSCILDSFSMLGLVSANTHANAGESGYDSFTNSFNYNIDDETIFLGEI
jgi:hypothetical protein